MIDGYKVGTEVKWNADNSLSTGVIERVFRRTEKIDIDGMALTVKVNKNSPAYLIRHHSGEYIIMPHSAVMRRRVNSHT